MSPYGCDVTLKRALFVLIAVTLSASVGALATSSSWNEGTGSVNADQANASKSKDRSAKDGSGTDNTKSAKDGSAKDKRGKKGAGADKSGKSAGDKTAAGKAAATPAQVPPEPSCNDAQPLQNRIDTAPEGATITLSGRLCLDRRITVTDKLGLTLEGDGTAVLRQARQVSDKMFVVSRSSGVVFRRLEIAGASPAAGNRAGAYSNATAQSAAIALKGVDHFVLEGSYIHDVYGDFVDIDAGRDLEFSTGVVIRDNRFVRNGRMGISTGKNVRDVVLSGNTMSDVRWSAFDLEPDTSQASTSGVQILDNKVDNYRHYFLSVGGVGHFADVRVAGNQVQLAGTDNAGLGFVHLPARKTGRPPVTGFSMCRNTGDMVTKNTLAGAVDPVLSC